MIDANGLIRHIYLCLSLCLWAVWDLCCVFTHITASTQKQPCKLTAFSWDRSQFPVSATWCRCCHHSWLSCSYRRTLLGQFQVVWLMTIQPDNRMSPRWCFIIFPCVLLMSDALLSFPDPECLCGVWNRLTRETNHMKKIKIKIIPFSLVKRQLPQALTLGVTHHWLCRHS